MKKTKLTVILCLMLFMGLYAGSVYANDTNAVTNTNEGYNIEVKSMTDKEGKTVEYLASVDDDGYLRITQIIQNSQNVKINTTTFEGKLLISGKVAKETILNIKVFNSANEKDATLYEAIVGLTETFSQPIEIKEGDNTIIITYTNKKDNIDGYVTFYVSRASTQKMEAIKSTLFIPSI